MRMVSLDQPMITLGALYFAGQRDSTFTGGESGKGLLAGGFASSSAQFVVDEARSMAGVSSSAVSDELAQALVGAGLSKFGDPIPQNNAMARGIMYGVADQAFTSAGWTVGQFMGGVSSGGGGSSNNTQTTQTTSTSSSDNMVL